MTNDDMMMGEGGEGVKDNKRTLLKLSMMFFWWGEEVPTKKITLYIWCYVPKEIILALRVVPGCERPSTMVRNPTYGVLSQRQYCRELHAQGGG